eukprot:gnl/MRDRNA2_/MRDRNA2_108283_c0_seq1.p1 gnl/MRDRNA2_/MRDRNA2_108283_c0~~gnl/MRDRNA2_/MRDRNA2_108283_c0_seq1.p1  ORF type:complete len:101 (-),score=5.15 gnl/MRDRNA2_/MRDRNA2_108283_c0_seq1:129-431(-)
MALFLALGRPSASVHSSRNSHKQEDCYGGISTLFASTFVVKAREQGNKGHSGATDTSRHQSGTQKLSSIPESNIYHMRTSEDTSQTKNTSTTADYSRDWV